MKKAFLPFLYSILFFSNTEDLFSQTTTNQSFSFGSYGRVGVGLSPSVTGNVGRPFNLNGMGSIGGRMEEADYVELLAALHFKGKEKSDTPFINVQARMALYASNWQLIGNVNSNSPYGAITVALPELYAEALNINGSKWSAWIGAKFFRGYDVHIADYFYFDDHSTQGFGVSWNKTTFSVLFPGAVDTSSSVPPYFYVNIVDGVPRLGLRARTMLIGEQLIPFDNNKQTIKILGEYHHLANANLEDTATAYNYPSAGGWVAGLEHTIILNTFLGGSSNQAAIRYGKGIANGNDGGNSKTWLTYGAPDLNTYKYNKAYSINLVDQLLLNISPKYSINAYGIFTKSHGASDSLNKAPDFFGREIYNRKTEYALGVRNFWYIKPWFHLITELDYANRKDGDQPSASVFKFSFVPTIVPTAKNDPWARPQLRLIYTICRYNDYAANHSYSPFLSEVGNKIWGQYIGVRAEWWLY
ncbi:MAG TPA: carbohydrate porin [Puia sp.]|nr:carbohydrate porin [Puia sp.]